MEELEKDMKSSRNDTSANQATEYGRRQAKLLAPITEIFEKQLKPRLEKLPTRAQKRMAEGTDSQDKKP